MEQFTLNIKFPLVLQESKREAFFFGMFFIASYVIALVIWADKHGGLLQFIPYLVVVVFIVGIILWLYPVSTLSIYEDRFEYRKGKFLLVSKWSDVKYVAVSPRDISSFFIETLHGTTKLMDARILRVKDIKGSRLFSREELMAILKNLTNKEAIYGDISYTHNKKTVHRLIIFVIVIYTFTLLMFR